eukprot:357980-Chlamydomonas_euryale.AAC.2
MTGFLTGGSRPPRQKSGFDVDPSHLGPICGVAISQRSEQRQRNVPWKAKPDGTLLKILLHWNLESP